MRTYVLLFIAALLSEISINLPVGSLPLALVSEGATEHQASITMVSGMLAALVVSIPLGVLVDRLGSLVIMRTAVFGAVAVMLAMGFSHGILAGCIEMALRSFLMIAFMTAQFAYASNIFSKERMVSAVASMGIIGNLAYALGPAIGVYLWQSGIHQEQYIYASLLNLVAGLIVLTLPSKYDRRKQQAASRRRILFRMAWLPAMAFIFSCSLQGGVNFALAVLEFHSRGIANGALLFTAAALTTVLLRYPAGRLVETKGARLIAIPTAIMTAIGCLLASISHSTMMVALAGIFLGVAWAAVPPIGIALLFERCSDRIKGTAMGSYNLAMGGGFAFGTIIAAITTAIGLGYTQAILTCSLIPCAALAYLYSAPQRRSKMTAVSG